MIAAWKATAYATLALSLASGGEGDKAPVAGEASVPAPRVLQIQARVLWTSSGKRIEDGLVVIADGRIRSIGTAADVDPAQPLVRHDGTVTAGLVACRSDLGTRGDLQDDTRSVLPRGKAAHAVDPTVHDFEHALEAGITTVGLSPGPMNVVGGLACAVETAHGTVRAPETALALSLSASALGRSTARGGFAFGAAGDVPGRARPDGSPETTARTTRGTREPTSYAGALETLEALLKEGRDAFGRAKSGELPVVIEAWDRHEVLRAAEFARAHELKGAVRGAPLAGDPDVIAALKAARLGAIVGPYSPTQTRPSLESLARLAEAGVPVGFALDAPDDSCEELRLTAVRALQAGATRETVWKALTEDAARLTGVADAGKLEPGQRADVVLWSGDPLDLGAHVVAVYVDGERAWPRSSGH